MSKMVISEEELTHRLAAFEEKCRQRGLRVTNQRREIFKTVAASRQHPSAEAVFLAVRQKMPRVSLDTVYRTLSSLEKMDLLIRVGTPEKERFDGDLRPHAHFICTNCAEVYDIFPPEISYKNPTTLACGKVKHVNVQFKGICKRCQS